MLVSRSGEELCWC